MSKFCQSEFKDFILVSPYTHHRNQSVKAVKDKIIEKIF